MQQFARRPEPDQPSNLEVSNDTLSQLLEQVSSLTLQVNSIREELAHLKAESRLPAQQEAQNPAEPTVEQASTPHVSAPIVDEAESVDEESFVEIARTSVLPETEQPVSAAFPEERSPMSDDEIQRLLAEAAGETPVVDVTEEPLQLRVDEFVPTGGIVLDSTVVARVPSHLAIAALAVPYKFDGATLFVKAATPFDLAGLDIIADAIACTVVPEEAPMEDVLAALRSAYAHENRDVERESPWEQEPVKKKRGLFRRSA